MNGIRFVSLAGEYLALWASLTRSEGQALGQATGASQDMSRHSVAAVLDAADQVGLNWDDVVERPDAEI